ncbi:hypothetical protein J1605_009937 [Eschrichtius robustus]|uniref:Uncharacterized protein n=1 Tax=Eschrichtius robustus TaxID=9764 RepID=A0AB34GTW3_ESCRO|nr:hypothetical protein J1605_009937 [Eschrichtius robustus]
MSPSFGLLTSFTQGWSKGCWPREYIHSIFQVCSKLAAAVSVQTTPQNVPSRSGLPHMHSQLEHRPSQRSSSPVGLAKWFGSDVLQQPLPSMPAKVISVDELEYRQ